MLVLRSKGGGCRGSLEEVTDGKRRKGTYLPSYTFAVAGSIQSLLLICGVHRACPNMLVYSVYGVLSS